MYDGADYYQIDELLDPEERLVRDTARQFVEQEYLPVVTRALPRTAPFRSSSRARVGALGFYGANLPHRVRLRRAQQRRLRPDQPGARARRLRAALVRQRAVRPGDVPDLRLRLRGAEAPLAAAPGARRGDRLLRPHRARLRLEPGRHADARACRSTAAIGSTAPSAGSPTATSPTSRWCGRRSPTATATWCAASWSSAARTGFTHARDAGQVQPARVDHLGAVPRGLRRAGRQRPAGRAGHARPALVPDPGALRHLLGRDRRGHRLLRVRARLRRASASCSRRPIAGYQLVQAKLVDMLTEITKAQLLCLRLGRLKDAGTHAARAGQLAKMNNVSQALHIARAGARHPRRQRHHRRVPGHPPHAEPRDGEHLRGHRGRPPPDHRQGHHRLGRVRAVNTDFTDSF